MKDIATYWLIVEMVGLIQVMFCSGTKVTSDRPEVREKTSAADQYIFACSSLQKILYFWRDKKNLWVGAIEYQCYRGQKRRVRLKGAR